MFNSQKLIIPNTIIKMVQTTSLLGMQTFLKEFGSALEKAG